MARSTLQGVNNARIKVLWSRLERTLTAQFYNCTFVGNKVIGECLQIACELVELQQFMIVVIRNDDIFGVARHVNNLAQLRKQADMRKGNR